MTDPDSLGISAHLVVLAVWCLAAASLVGLGEMLRRWWGLTTTSWRDISASFWVGIALAIGLLQAWHLVRPVDGGAAIGLALLGLLGCIVARHDLVRIARAADPRLAGIAAVVLLWIANRALGPVVLTDTGMYHQPVVAWTNAYPIIPGLGNLHGRLAFNSSALLFAAPFDTGRLDGAAVHLVISLLLAALVVEGICAWATARRATTPRAWDLFSLAILPNAIHGVLRPETRSLSTDAAVAAVLFVAMRALVDLVAHPDPDRRDNARRGAVVVLLFTLAVTVKLSAAAMALAGVLVVAWLVLRASDGTARLRVADVTMWALPPILLFGIWVVRGVVASGYPLYPATVLPFPVSWRVPAEEARAAAAWIEMSARNLNSNTIYAGTSWIVPWVRGVIVRGDPFVQFVVPTVLALGAALLLLRVRSLPDEAEPPFARSLHLAWIPIVAGGVFWLASAPHPRMAQAVAWSAAAVTMSLWATRRVTTRLPAVRIAVVALCVATGLVAKQAAGAAWRATPAERLDAAARALVTLPDSGRWVAPLPVPILKPVPIATDLTVMLPSDDNLCWNTTELCSAHPSSSLRYRRPEGGAAAGFVSIEGKWDPMRWPNPWTPFLAWWRCVNDGGVRGATVERACLQRTGGGPGSGPGA